MLEDHPKTLWFFLFQHTESIWELCAWLEVCLIFWAGFYILIYTHCQEMMKSVGSHGPLSQLFMTKVMMVWDLVGDSYKVMATLIVMLPSKCCHRDFSTVSIDMWLQVWWLHCSSQWPVVFMITVSLEVCSTLLVESNLEMQEFFLMGELGSAWNVPRILWTLCYWVLVSRRNNSDVHHWLQLALVQQLLPSCS